MQFTIDHGHRLSKRLRQQLLPGFICLITFNANAEVRQLTDNGFTVHHEVDIAAPVETVYENLTVNFNKWWDASHSWGTKAQNLYFDTSPGGCFCEKLEGGGHVEHLRLVALMPPSQIRLVGALGPLLDMGLHGTMIWKLSPTESGTRFEWTYIVQGQIEGGFARLAPAVDGVNGGALASLAMFTETSK